MPDRRSMAVSAANLPIPCARPRAGGSAFLVIVLAFPLALYPVGAWAQLVPSVQSPPPSAGAEWPLEPSVVQAQAEKDIQEAQNEVDRLIHVQSEGFDSADPHEKTDVIVRNAALMFERVVRPRMENATLGCHESEVGSIAWFSYWRQLQFWGVADNPDVHPLVLGYRSTGTLDLPDSYFDTLFGLCASEAHDRCVATGDFPGVFEPLTAMERIWNNFMGKKMKPGWVNMVVGYARACGQWTLSIRTDFRHLGTQSSEDETCCGITGKVPPGNPVALGAQRFRPRDIQLEDCRLRRCRRGCARLCRYLRSHPYAARSGTTSDGSTPWTSVVQRERQIVDATPYG